MSKIPFTLDAWLKDKSRRVETRDGRVVHNIWRVKEPFYTNNRRAEVCALIDGEEDALVFFEGGRYLPTTKDTDSPFDLFIVTPEPELSEFEKVVSEFAKEVMGYTFQEVAGLRNCARQLMIAASKQFIKDGYVIEKKAFHDAVEKVEPEVMKAVSENVDVINEAYERGKAEARTHATELTENLIKSGLDKDSIPYHLIEFMCNLYTCQNWKEIEDTAEAYATRLRAAAMKDLPRWKISLPEPGKRYVLLFNGGSIVESRDYRRGNFYYEDKNIEYNPKCVRWMYAEELYQLPGGFKED